MITRTVRIQLVVFVALTLVGTAVAGIRYAGLGRTLLGGTYVVDADFADAGGIFTGAEVTYRGVAVGRVDRLRPTRSGVDVALTLDAGTRVPADTLAVVANRSAIGEQYVDLQPRQRGGPYLRDGTRIARADTRTPLPTTTLLLDLDRLASSVPKKDLVTVLDELGTAFAGTGPDLARLVDAGNSLVETADANLAQTVDLIDRGGTVLDTQRDSGTAIRSFAGDLADLSDTVAGADPDLREVLASGVLTAQQVQGLVDENAGDVSVLLANLASTGQLVRVRLRGVQQALILYPYVVRGGYTVVARDPGTGHYTAHFGLQLATSPGSCRQGYQGTRRRSPQELGPTPVNTDARCTDRTTTERGAQNAPGAGAGAPRTGPKSPRPGAPQSDAGRSGSGRSGVRPAAYDPATGVVRLPGGEPARIGSLGGEQRAFGKESWKWLLIGPMTR
ncbi:MlaD family protein [Actinopolymorpha sp. NPDC004070]|uniref:MlaD family protein n=1 Tax=Actinopolymorpha sp. NPDC004070 TaxID=3154548 RepID=UPI0033B42E7D